MAEKEEQVQELAPVTFAEINAQHQAGDPMNMPPAEVQGKTEKTDKVEKTDKTEKTEPVNWEEKHKTLETEFTKKEQDYLAKIRDHESKITEYEKKPPPIAHKDSDLSRLEVVKETVPEKFSLYTKLLWGNPDAADLWKMDFIQKNPEYKDDPETVQMMLEAEFKDYFGEDVDTESREYKVAQNRLKIAGNQIKAQNLAEFKAIAVSDPQEVEKTQQQQKTELAKSWEITFSEMTKNPIKVSQKIALDDKSEIDVDFGIQPEDSKKYNEAMGLFILHNNLKPTAENAQKARDYAMGEVIREKFPEILKATFQKEFDKRYAAWQKTRNNNQPFGTTTISTDGKKSIDQQINETIETGEPHVPSR